VITYSAAETIGNPVANMAIFGVFVLVHPVRCDPRQQAQRDGR
jgi:hypothetical protein